MIIAISFNQTALNHLFGSSFLLLCYSIPHKARWRLGYLFEELGCPSNRQHSTFAFAWSHYLTTSKGCLSEDGHAEKDRNQALCFVQFSWKLLLFANLTGWLRDSIIHRQPSPPSSSLSRVVWLRTTWLSVSSQRRVAFCSLLAGCHRQEVEGLLFYFLTKFQSEKSGGRQRIMVLMIGSNFCCHATTHHWFLHRHVFECDLNNIPKRTLAHSSALVCRGRKGN